jgi:hypothetical protein
MLNRVHEIDAAVVEMSRYMTGLQEDAAEAIEAEKLRNMPNAEHPALFPVGLVREFVDAACTNSEAPPAGVAMALLSFISASAGRGLYLPVGDDFHHPLLMFVHVARTNLGKGVSFGLLRRVKRVIRDSFLVTCPGLLAHEHTGGLSTREGLAALIPDARPNKEGDLEGGTEDKRAFIVESEFANVLTLARRQGNTISTALRDCWDGADLSPLTKNDRISCTDPHVALLANITPSELTNLLTPGDVNNGFANRLLFVLAESGKSIPDPQPCPQPEVDDLARRIADVVTWAKGSYPADKDSRRMELSESAKALRNAHYERLKRPIDEPFLAALLARGRAHVLRLAMLFAICDKSLVIDDKHFLAALAWVTLWQQSCLFIFRRVANEAKAEKTTADAAKLIQYLTEKQTAVSRTDISKACFGGHASAGRISAAVELLLMRNPPAIEVQDEKTPGKPKGKQLIKLAKREAAN